MISPLLSTEPHSVCLLLVRNLITYAELPMQNYQAAFYWSELPLQTGSRAFNWGLWHHLQPCRLHRSGLELEAFFLHAKQIHSCSLIPPDFSFGYAETHFPELRTLGSVAEMWSCLLILHVLQGFGVHDMSQVIHVLTLQTEGSRLLPSVLFICSSVCMKLMRSRALLITRLHGEF